jgi:hypothetical protein
MTLVDLSPHMLATSRSINPELEHIEGDMRAIRLGREFDAVFVHDAILYMTTEDDLRAAIETAYVHCRPGGVAAFAPELKDGFRPSTRHGGHDAPDGRGLRYLEWRWDPDPDDHTYVCDFAYLLREADGAVRVEHDRHIMGIFSRADWLRLLRDAGFDPQAVAFEPEEAHPGELEAFVARKPAR